MASVQGEINRIATAKSDIETAIENCGVTVPDNALISTYASYIRQIPSAVFSSLNANLTGGSDAYIESIEQSNGIIETTVGGLVSTSKSGLVPKADMYVGTIDSSTADYVLTRKGNVVDWYRLPANAFKNDNTTYTLTPTANTANTFTVTPSVGNAYNVAITPAVKVDGITGATITRYASCSTTATTAAKVASISSGTFTLESGARVSIKFIYANTASNPTLNINSTGAKNIYHKGARITTGDNKSLLAGLVDLVYDGVQWHIVGNYVDNAVLQTSTTTSANYRVLFSHTANDTTATEGARKSSKLMFNPSTGVLTATKFSGSLDWSNLSSIPETFTPSAHNHPTSEINKLTDYSKGTSTAALATTDTLNAALSKLECKADLGKSAYDIVSAAYDGDGTIENLNEILRVLNGLSDTVTLNTIIGNYLLKDDIDPSLGISGNTINVKVGGVASSYITVPYATNANTLQGNGLYNPATFNSSGIPKVTSGVTEFGYAIDFHSANNVSDYNVRLRTKVGEKGNYTVTLPSATGTLALTSQIPTKTSDLTNDSGFIDTDTNYYPTTFTWTGGTTYGPTGSLTGVDMSAVSFAAIPSASDSASGVVTTGTQTFAGQKTFTGVVYVGSSASNYLRIGSSSNYLYGYYSSTASSNYMTLSSYCIKFAYAGTVKMLMDSGAFCPNTNGGMDLGKNSTRWNYIYSNYGYSTNGYFESSDERLKNILNPVKVNLDELAKLRKIYYTWKDDSKPGIQLGMVAQDVQKLYPELVDVNSETGYLSLAYDRLSVIALEAIDSVYSMIKDLKEENLELKSRVNKLEKLL